MSYTEGDNVRVKVLDVDINRNRVSFGLKPSYLNVTTGSVASPHLTSVGNPDETDCAPRDPADIRFEDSSVCFPSGDLLDEAEELHPPRLPSLQGLEVQHGFDWEDIPSQDSETELRVLPVLPQKIDTEQSVDAVITSQSAKGAETDCTLDLRHQNPRSDADFRRLLLGSPNSSFLWIQYASFHLQTADTGKARDTLRQALKTIHYQEQKERFNVWVSLLNIECNFGDGDSLEAVFREAASAFDGKKICLKVASLLHQADKPQVGICLVSMFCVIDRFNREPLNIIKDRWRSMVEAQKSGRHSQTFVFNIKMPKLLVDSYLEV